MLEHTPGLELAQVLRPMGAGLAFDSLMAVAVETGEEFTMSTSRALVALGRRLPGFDVNAEGEFVTLRHLVPRPNPPSLVLLEDWKALLRP